MKEYTVRVHDVATDGLPDMDDRKLVGRVAFIFDGCIVTGWPLIPERLAREGVTVDADVREHAAAGDVLWEGDSDVARNIKFADVTQWVEFPVKVWSLESVDLGPTVGD